MTCMFMNCMMIISRRNYPLASPLQAHCAKCVRLHFCVSLLCKPDLRFNLACDFRSLGLRTHRYGGVTTPWYKNLQAFQSSQPSRPYGLGVPGQEHLHTTLP